MIYTLTLNPAIDYYVHYDQSLSKHQVTSQAVELAGGKGINAAVILQNLGTPVQTIFVCGGFNGQKLMALTKQMQLNILPVIQPRETRINVKANFNNDTYEFNAHGLAVDAAAINAQVLTFLAALNEHDYVMIMGSLPVGYEVKDLTLLMDFIKARQANVVLDLSAHLLALLKYEPLLIKPNRKELAAMFNVDIDTQEIALKYAQELVKRGAKNVLVSFDKDGALFTNGKQSALMNGLAIKEVNGSGAGDAMIATALNFLVLKVPLEKMLAWASGAGTATAATTGLATKSAIEKYAKQVKVKWLTRGEDETNT